MTNKTLISEIQLKKRREQLLGQLNGGAALIVSNPQQSQSRDLTFRYREDSDLFYLTGITEPEVALLLLDKPKSPRSILYLRERDIKQEIWVGERLGVKRARAGIDVDEVKDIRDFEFDFAKLMEQVPTLHYAAGINPQIDSLVWEMFQTTVGPRLSFPNAIFDLRLLTAPMRVKKDAEEIKLLREVAKISADGFKDFIPLLKHCTTEKHAAKILEAMFIEFGADDTSFETIIASGKNATCLHHHPTHKTLAGKELVLIDAGARRQGYAADITRTVPYSGKFSLEQREAYEIVNRAVDQAIAFSKPGVSLEQIHTHTVQVITEGLVEAKIIRGTVSQAIKKELYKNFFMHKTGHLLGIDTHDISPIFRKKRGKIETGESFRVQPLEPGNVFTIEPGLYFRADNPLTPRRFRGIGIRIEEDVLITSKGCEVLTKLLPREAEEIEALVG
jgi:Xaa-Pro aminopeptidase